MSNPVKPAMRAQQRKWAGHFQHAANVDVRFVLGTTFFNNTQRPPPEWDELKAEEKEHKDIIFVEGREKLPHVGVVTEKSASFWLSRGAESPGYEWYCKCDDDTLVHLSRLGETLANVTRSLGRTAHVYFGHLKWRGWEAGHRFQACGGGWGDSAKTLSDILGGGGMPDGSRYPPCPHAAGPVPYMSGGMVCMSRPLAVAMAADAAFRDFYETARKRNDRGVACKRPERCAAQPYASHMWHHEDAGVGFNVFRAAPTQQRKVHILPVPGHYNDPYIIERTRWTESVASLSAEDEYWSRRALFVHGIKTRKSYQEAERRWELGRASADLRLHCAPCDLPNTNRHNGNWRAARLPCAHLRNNTPAAAAAAAALFDDASPAAREAAKVGAAILRQESGAGRFVDPRFCAVPIGDAFACCGWPWQLPQLRSLVLRGVAAWAEERGGASSEVMTPEALHKVIKRLYRDESKGVHNRKGCVADCLRIVVPRGVDFEKTLAEMELRGDVRLLWSTPDGKRPPARGMSWEGVGRAQVASVAP